MKSGITRGLCFVMMILAGSCGEVMINGKWKDRDIFIDGADSEWRGAKYLLDRQYMTVGAVNNSDSLYIRISTADAIRQYRTLAVGMIVRLTPRKKDSSALEVKFPLGNTTVLMSRNDKAFDPKMKVRENRIRSLESTLTDSIGVVVNDSLVVYSSEEAKMNGIIAMSGIDTRSLVSEFSIPLGAADAGKWALDAQPGDEIDLEIILPAPDGKIVKKLLYERYGTTPNAFNSGVRRRSDAMVDEHCIAIRLLLAKQRLKQ